MSRFALYHCLGFEPREKAIDGRLRPTPRLGKLPNRNAKLASVERDDLAADIERRRLPAGA